MDIATIGFEADTSGLEQAEKHLDAIPPKASAAEKAASKWGSAAVISGQQIGKAMRSAASEIGAFETVAATATETVGALSAVMGGPLLIAAGLVVGAIVAITGGLALFIHNSIEAEKIGSQLEATLTATGGAAGQSAEQLDKHAQALQDLTTFEDDAIKGAQTVLLTFTRIRGDVFPKATEATLDLAQAMGIDLKSAAFTVGKALDNPIRGSQLLRRAGIDLGATQQQLIKDMVAGGKADEARGVILKALETRFGGAAAAAKNTLGGALKSLGNAFGNMFELASDQLNPLTEMINELTKSISAPEFKQFLDIIGVLLVQALAFVVNAINRVMQGINLLIDGLKALYGWVSDKVTAALDALGQKFQETFGTTLSDAVRNGINAVVGEFVAGWIEIEFRIKNLPTLLAAAMVDAADAVAKGAVAMVNALATPLNSVNEFLNKNVRPAGSEKPGMTLMDPPTPIPNPFRDSLTKADETGTQSPIDAKDAEKAIARTTDWVGKLSSGATTATAKVKAVGGAVRDVSDDLDDGGKKAEDAFKKIVTGVENAIAKLKTETDTIGMSVAATAEAKTMTELLGKAKEADLKLTDSMIAKLKDLAHQTGEVTNANAAAKGTFDALQGAKEFIAQQKLAQAQMGMSAEAASRLAHETELLDKASQHGAVTLRDDQVSALKDAAAEMAKTEQATKDMNEAISFTKDIFSDLFSDLKDALIQGKNIWQSFGDAVMGVLSKIADKLLSMALDGLIKGIMPGSSGSSSSSSGGGLLGGLSNFFGANGGGFGNLINQTSNWFSGLFGGDSMARAGTAGSSFFGPVAPSTGVLGSGISTAGLLGALGGGLSGIMQLTRGGGIGSTLGGIGSLIGAGVSFIPGIGQIAGPAIALLSSILPGLLGGSKPTINNSEYGQLSYGAGGFSTSGGAWGPTANAQNLQGPLGQIGSTMDSIYKAFGGVKDAGKVWGLALESRHDIFPDNSEFSNQTSFLVDPSGNKTQYGQGSNEHDIGLESAAVRATVNSILGGAVGEITDAMKTALSGINADAGMQNLAQTVADIKAYDDAVSKFGTDTTDAANVIAQVDSSFQSLYDTIEKYNLGQAEMDKVNAERDRVRLKATEDFTYGISQSLLSFTDPLQAQLNDLEKQHQADLANNADYVKLVAGYNDQAANLNELYLKQRNQIEAQFNQAALDAQKSILGSLQTYINQLLPGGALAGEGLASQLQGLTGTYAAAKAQATASPTDQAKVNAFMQAGQDLLEFEKSFYGGDERYQQARLQALADAKAIQDAVAQGVTQSQAAFVAGGGTADPDFQDLIDAMNAQTEQINTLLESQAQLNAIIRRRQAQGG